MSLKNGYLAIALMGGLSMVACSNTAVGVKKDAEVNAEKTADAADKAGDKAAVATERAAEKTDVAIDKAQAAGHEAVANTKAAGETIDVKSALMADHSVDASHINVDTFAETKTVVLKGSVKSASQRSEAARIAAAKAPGYRIDNQLTVVANP